MISPFAQSRSSPKSGIYSDTRPNGYSAKFRTEERSRVQSFSVPRTYQVGPRVFNACFFFAEFAPQ